MDEQTYLPPRIDEPAYCEIRNHVRIRLGFSR